MSTKEAELSMTTKTSRCNFEANPHREKCKVVNSTLEKIARIANHEKMLLRYKQSVEEMRNTGLIVQICAARNGLPAHNAPQLHNALHYGALTLAFGQALYLARKVSPTAANDGSTQISFYQILCYIIHNIRAWRLNQTPQISCSQIDFDLDTAFQI